MTLIEAAKLALEALEHEVEVGNDDAYRIERDALTQAIAEAEQQEPVYLIWMKAHYAWMHTDREVFDKTHDELRWLLYTTPPKREWQGLTDEDVEEVERWVEFKEEGSGRIPTGKLVRYIEAKLKEKNT